MATWHSEQKYWGSSSGWYSHRCIFMRGSLDIHDTIVPVHVGTKILFRAGFVVWKPSKLPLVQQTVDTNSKSYGEMESWQIYTVQDNAALILPFFVSLALIVF